MCNKMAIRWLSTAAGEQVKIGDQFSICDVVRYYCASGQYAS